ncbi:MAG TPA: M23 family metallopeptidase, partial [Burkholderiaceae bacterium]|nr:M23 family metallopeptidase [Burkholderiaceae bacterium]
QDGFPQSESIRRGETLGSLLARLGADDPEFAAFVKRDPIARKLLQLQSGRTVTTTLAADGTILRLAYRLRNPEAARPGRRLVIERNGAAIVALEEDVAFERQIEMRSAEILTSLFAATDAAGIPDAVASRVADVFDADIDFNRDLRRGDRLRVIYETLRDPDSLDSAVVSRVLAAELSNASRRLEAVWFDAATPDGEAAADAQSAGNFYTFDGRSLRRALLRSPLEFSRVTSGFSNARLHPILQQWRAHRGVDYAAPTGTPVRTVGTGTVEFAGVKGGYGNVVVIRHNAKYTTLYAHLNGFASGIARGRKVSQGDLIGYVGATGWATGPHLHYELHVDGLHTDPMRVALPAARPLEGAALQRFREVAALYLHQLEQLDTVQLARFE